MLALHQIFIFILEKILGHGRYERIEFPKMGMIMIRGVTKTPGKHGTFKSTVWPLGLSEGLFRTPCRLSKYYRANLVFLLGGAFPVSGLQPCLESEEA